MYRQAEEAINVNIVGYTEPKIEGAEDISDLISYCARVSNPTNQSNFDTAEGLLNYCIKNNHWSIFEMANVVMEIEVPRDIARQILRHKSFSFQEFSQRYAQAQQLVLRECRTQDLKNRQNSNKTEDEDLNKWWERQQEDLINYAEVVYLKALEKGIAKEVARVILPEGNTMSRMYMNGTVRSWLHYCDLREGHGTQQEHIWAAQKCREQLKTILPNLFNKEG
jgi:thymidylate synthase (FAD)